ETLAARLRRGEEIPGFGHTLYPGGDPRAAALLEIAAATKPELATSLIEAARELIGEPPNLDFGLVTLARGLGLPERTPLALFALGRSIGWIGHALEEYALDRLIRPRAAYVGEPAGTLQET
ncbi:MAG TPA: citrate/2-methylcitrate synthase, partial [Thermoanaerobaculia bacterium]